MLLWLNVKNRQQLFEGVLTIKAGIGQISSFRFPLRKATVIKHLFGVFNNERKSNAVKKAKRDGEKLTPKEKKELTDAEKEYKSKRKMIQEKLIKFATRVDQRICESYTRR